MKLSFKRRKKRHVFNNQSDEDEDGSNNTNTDLPIKEDSKSQDEQKISGKDLLKLEKKAMNEKLRKLNQASTQKVENIEKELAKQDSSIFDYDNAIEEDKRKRQDLETKQLEEGKKSKYIEQLLKTAKEREFEHEIARDKAKRLEENLEGADEVFVTGAYKKKLEERKQWELEQKRLQAEEEANAPNTKTDMSGFYRSILDKVDEKNVYSSENGGQQGANKIHDKSEIDKNQLDIDKNDKNQLDSDKNDKNQLDSDKNQVDRQSESKSYEKGKSEIKKFKTPQVVTNEKEKNGTRMAPQTRVTANMLEQAKQRAIMRAEARKAKKVY